jgi:hypothetical protein
MEALKRYRSGGEQKMIAQHVHVAEGGQAIVGNVSASAPGGGAIGKTKEQPHALGYARSVEMPRQVEKERVAVPSSGGSGFSVCRMHGAGASAPRGKRNAWCHRNYSAKAIETRRTIIALIRQTRQLVEML